MGSSGWLTVLALVKQTSMGSVRLREEVFKKNLIVFSKIFSLLVPEMQAPG